MNVKVPISIESVEDSDFPIYVKFSIINSKGSKVYFIEKLIVISDVIITDKSLFPIRLDIECEQLSEFESGDGCIEIKLPYDIESIDGDSSLFIEKAHY